MPTPTGRPILSVSLEAADDLLLAEALRGAADDVGLRPRLRGHPRQHDDPDPDRTIGLAVAAYAGLCPRERTSGSSVRGRSRTGPLGPAALRKALYLPAMVAMRANPALRVFAERLRAAGTCPKVVVVAVVRQLLELAWTLLRSGQPFSVSQGAVAPTPRQAQTVSPQVEAGAPLLLVA